MSREIMQMALDQLKRTRWASNCEAGYSNDPVIAALRQALAQPEQEPKLSDAGVDTNIPLWGLEPKGKGMVTLHERQWVGLTDEDMHIIRDDAFVKNVDDINWGLQMVRRVEAKLKEKNT